MLNFIKCQFSIYQVYFAVNKLYQFFNVEPFECFWNMLHLPLAYYGFMPFGFDLITL